MRALDALRAVIHTVGAAGIISLARQNRLSCLRTSLMENLNRLPSLYLPPQSHFSHSAAKRALASNGTRQAALPRVYKSVGIVALDFLQVN